MGRATGSEIECLDVNTMTWIHSAPVLAGTEYVVPGSGGLARATVTRDRGRVRRLDGAGPAGPDRESQPERPEFTESRSPRPGRHATGSVTGPRPRRRRRHRRCRVTRDCQARPAGVTA